MNDNLAAALDDGWEDDDLDDLNEEWGDNDNDNNDNDDDEGEIDFNKVETKTTEKTISKATFVPIKNDPSTSASTASSTTYLTENIAHKPPTNASTTAGIVGWEEEQETGEDLEVSQQGNSLPPLANNHSMTSSRQVHINTTFNPSTDDGWDDDDDLDLDSVDEPVDAPKPTLAPQFSNLTHQQNNTYQKLHDYVCTLPHLVTSLNAVLEADFNTPTHAKHLIDYYQDRPQLMAYTIDTEVPRMDYQVTSTDGATLMNKQDVRTYLHSQPNNSILIRAANQSLLADILTVLTGDVIVPKFLATTICTSCRFVLDPLSVHVNCNMSLSLPDQSGTRMDVAEILVTITFDPGEEVIIYQIKQINLVLTDMNALKGTATFLSEMDSNIFEQQERQQPTSADAVRDNFLKQLSITQQMAQQTSTGLSSALRQIDRVANVSNKVSALSKLMPILPTSADIMAMQVSPMNALRPEPPAARADKNRPRPILGGFLMSGLSRLANTIVPGESVHHEEMPSLYQKEQPPKSPEPSSFYRRVDPISPATQRQDVPSLYRRPDPTFSSQLNRQPPTLYVRPNPPPRPPHDNMSLYRQPPPPRVDDGWDDDDEELTFDEDNDEPATSAFDTTKATPADSSDGFVMKPLPTSTVIHKPPGQSGENKTFVVPEVLGNRVPLSSNVSRGVENKEPVTVRPPPPPRPPTQQTPESHAIIVEALVAPIPPQDYPPTPFPLVDYNSVDDIIPTRVRWTRSR
jgi:hypothetical protein